MGTARSKTEHLVVARGLVNRLWRWIGRIAPPPPGEISKRLAASSHRAGPQREA
jgi:hypothetical protein